LKQRVNALERVSSTLVLQQRYFSDLFIEHQIGQADITKEVPYLITQTSPQMVS
jgi:hypothetical protein